MINIETNRLLIKPYIDADAPLMALLHSNPKVMAFMKDRKPLSADEVAATFARYLECWEIDGFGIFSVRINETDTFIGKAGFWHRQDKPGVSMRYLLDSPYWGQGYGSEMNVAITAWLFNETDVKSFWAETQARSKGSIAILRRLGGVISEAAHMGVEGLLRIDVTRSAWKVSQAHT